MIPVGGNTTATIERSSGDTFNEVGERIKTWQVEETLTGWLDYMAGEAQRTEYKAKLVDATHVFVANYKELAPDVAERCRFVHNGSIYEIVYVDNPMGLNYHLEIFLRKVGL